MTYKPHQRHPLSDGEMEFLKEMKKFGLTKIAQELNVTKQSICSSISTAIKERVATGNLIARLQKVHEVLSNKNKDQMLNIADSDYEYLEYNAYPLLDALLRKSKDKILYQEVADHAMATFIDLCNQHGEEKGVRLALIVLDLE
jgi:hypothetical protein